jgi:ribulose-5-phosphate 4-epimerase/fuculose-1-phosphate aldolase
MEAIDSLREEMCRVGRSLFERGYVHATAGNISVRLPATQGFLITPTDACLGFLQPGQLAHTDIRGQPLSGPPASKTLSLHQSIYAPTAPTWWR